MVSKRAVTGIEAHLELQVGAVLAGVDLEVHLAVLSDAGEARSGLEDEKTSVTI
jgi:hypothetical protein